MLDSITIKINSSNPLDIGYLAECLLFYNNTNLLIDKDSLTKLFRLCGVDEIKYLIEKNNLSIHTKENIFGAGTKNNLFFIDLMTVQNVDKHFEIIYEAFYNLYEKQGKARRNALGFASITHSYRYNPDILIDIRDSIRETEFIRQIINSFLKEINYEKEFLGKEWFYDFKDVDGYTFEHITNLNLEKLKEIATINNVHFDFSPTSLMLDLAESYGDIQVALNNNSEIFTTSHNSKIINLKFENIFEKAQLNRDVINKFQKIALPNYKNLALIINEGNKSYKDLIKLLEKAEKFKEWKNDLSNESDFIEEYSKALEKETWLDRVPTKIGRFTIFEGVGILTDFLGAGGIGTLAATSLSVADTFFLDKLLRKWKPNQFIKEDFKKFVK